MDAIEAMCPARAIEKEGAAERNVLPFAGRPRLNREWCTIRAMIVSYCRSHHIAGSGRVPAGNRGLRRSEMSLCQECEVLLDYATVRLERCVFGTEKPTCVNCPVHCYQPARREQVKQVMRYAGPRMLWQHPILALRHWLDGFRKAPGT